MTAAAPSPAAPAWQVRPAIDSDVPAIFDLVMDLAVYEREPDAVLASRQDFATALFGPDPRLHAHVVELAGEVVGMALWFVSFSTWRGRHGIWLEDLFVRERYRGAGMGKALLAALARTCAERGYARLEWWVLDWNTPAIDFYRSLGARAEDSWTTYRLDGDALAGLAASSQGIR